MGYMKEVVKLNQDKNLAEKKFSVKATYENGLQQITTTMTLNKT